jgi:D-alanyl-D-alanine carboxypeptidase/D-alanyl-D-alanine-endopeptidase (penicillin-binding protein 4)
MRFDGRYPLDCGERLWPLAYAEPAGYNARMLAALWAEMGGRLQGQVRDGPAPVGLAPVFEFGSPPLGELLRDVNKQSLNVAAQQLWLSLALAQRPEQAATEAAARELLAQWLRQRLPGVAEGAVLDNGSGLSRSQRLSAAQLAALLQWAWRQPWMPELLASLPINGVDGTLRRNPATPGRAQLKTGSLDDVAALAGVVHGTDGQRFVLVAMVHHPQAGAARAALDALLQWVIDQAPLR